LRVYPDTLLESELFGHEKGAFTNAVGRRLGRFEEASGGTLFLDEIAELAPSLQAKLLRAIQEHTIERLGSNVSIHVDVRLIAATSRNLEQGLADGHFREDLYYRLNVVTIALPPLRDRKGDIPALVQHFLRRGRPPSAITPDALAMLCDYHWPGNIRELENTVARALVLAHGSLVEKSNILLLNYGPPETGVSWTDLVPLDRTWKDNIETLEKALLTRALLGAGGNKSKAAELLGIQRRLLYEKLRQYKVEVNP
jgi:DNA-binding NtrC family response regulator